MLGTGLAQKGCPCGRLLQEMCGGGRKAGVPGWGAQVEPRGPEEMKLSLKNVFYCQSSLDCFKD